MHILLLSIKLHPSSHIASCSPTPPTPHAQDWTEACYVLLPGAAAEGFFTVQGNNSRVSADPGSGK